MAKNNIKLKKSDFNAGSPYSCWLKEQVLEAIWKNAAVYGNPTSLDKYIVKNVSKLDDYPENIRRIAVEIIRRELDPTFEP